MHFLDLNKRKVSALTLCLTLWFVSCENAIPIASSHNSKGNSSQIHETQSVSCTQCHEYLIDSGQHRYHLVSKSDEGVNAYITCADCHFGSIQTLPLDTNTSHPHYIPKIKPSLSVEKMTGADVVDLITLVQFMDRFQGKYGRQTPELFTSADHLNGRVDVSFAPNALRVSDSLNWNPAKQGCSMISCHEKSSRVYLWN